MNIFKNNTNNKTAKDYIIEKRNLNLFYDISNNSTTNKLTCVKSNRIKKFNNHSNLLNITHGFFDYHQNKKCVDICNNLLSDEYNVEVFRNKKCSVIKNDADNNTNVSHNYNGIVITDDKYPNNTVVDLSENNIKHFTYVNSRNALASEKESNYFKYISKKKRTKCFKIKTTDILIE